MNVRSSLAATAALVIALALPALAAAAPKTGSAPGAGTPAVRTLARASWLSDRVPLRVGDLLTVVVDEQTSAHEQVSQVAQGTRTQRGTLDANANGDVAIGETHVATGMDGRSQDVGDAKRLGNLNGIVTVRVTTLTPDGLAEIQGAKKVTVDGRPQQVSIHGFVRPEDVAAGNRIASDRIANAEIAYTGKKISPRAGFIGKLLGALWP